jgi:hypothetical protein
MHQYCAYEGESGPTTLTLENQALDTKVLGAVAMIVNSTATTSATSLVLTCTRQDGTTVDITVALSADTQWAKSYLGMAAINTAGAAAGDVLIPINGATTQFKVGEQVLIRESESNQEVGIIESIVAGVSITLTEPLVGTYTSAHKVYPMFINIVWKSGTLADGKDVTIWAMPDRTIAL